MLMKTIFWKYGKIKLDQVTYACTAHVVVCVLEPRGTMKRGRGGWCVWQFPIPCFEKVPLIKGQLGGGEVAEPLCIYLGEAGPGRGCSRAGTLRLDPHGGGIAKRPERLQPRGAGDR